MKLYSNQFHFHSTRPKMREACHTDRPVFSAEGAWTSHFSIIAISTERKNNNKKTETCPCGNKLLIYIRSLFFCHVLFQFLCNLQQYCNSAYNKLNSLQQKEFINITKMNYIWKKNFKKTPCTHACTHAHTHTHTYTHNSKLKFKQLNGPTNRSTTILTK